MSDDDLEAIYGLRAALAVFATRRDDIVRVAYSAETRQSAADLVRWASQRGLPCREMDDRDLARIAESDHHEGLCLVTRARRWLAPTELADHLVRANGAAIALDRVRNPYNIGAILRSAAFFGIDAALLGAPAPHPALAPAAIRVAEGGVEHLALARTTDLVATLEQLRKRGVHIVGAESDANANAIGYVFARPLVLVLGNEREGISSRVRAACESVVAIPGAATVDSLNVSIAASLMMSEVMRESLRGRPVQRVARDVPRDERPRGRR
jgi:TrmH RNA methyltransferase